MSDTTTGTRPDPDEVASAYLDGELDDTQRAAVEADPALLARVDELAAVRAAVAGPVAPAPPAAQAAALAAALDVHDQLWAPRPVPTPEKRRWWERLGSRRVGPVLAGAALVAVAAVGVAAVVNNDNRSDSGSGQALSAPETTAAGGATAFSDATTATAGAQDASGSAGAGGGSAATGPAALATSAPAPYLGALGDDAELEPLLKEIPPASQQVVAEAETVQATQSSEATASGGGSDATSSTHAPTTPAQTVPAPATTAAASGSPPAAVPASLPPVALRTAGATCPAPEGTVFYATVDVEGVGAEIFVGTDRAVALAMAGCTTLAEVPLP